MKLGKKPRFPRPQSLILAHRAICTYVPSEELPVYEWRKSNAGTPNLRISAITNDLPWIVDVYSGHFFRCSVGSQPGSIHKTMLSLVGHLRKALNLDTEP